MLLSSGCIQMALRMLWHACAHACVVAGNVYITTSLGTGLKQPQIMRLQQSVAVGYTDCARLSW